MPKFTPPTVEEIQDYCDERENGIDAEYFHDYYSMVDWKQGKCCKPIKDWKACIRTWEKNNRKWNQEKQKETKQDFMAKITDTSWAD